ncbi:MAG: trehalase family glycosidase, partial [Gemmatimonadaceae bacterium]
MRGRLRPAGLVSVLVLGAACGRGASVAPPSAPTPAVGRYDPAHDLGALFTDVQLAGIFPDSKTFVDARPRRPSSEIAAAYQRAKGDAGFALRSFVDTNFDLPKAAGGGATPERSATVEQHVKALWPTLTRAADVPDPQSSLVPLPNEYVVPGGRFREVYYWDSYFTMLGLVQSGRTDLVRHMLENFAWLVQSVGHIPNGNRTYYLSRSQPPYFGAMVGLYAEATDTNQALVFLPALENEYAFWMEGSEKLSNVSAHRRVVK